MATPASVIKWWNTHGPYDGDPKANALDHLLRFNFEIDNMVIYQHPGFRLSREDRMAVDYLVGEHGYEYDPAKQTMPVKPPAGSTPAS